MACTVGLVTLLIVTMAIGIAVESANMSKARSTLSYFALDPVCALDNGTAVVYSTFENRTLALAANQTIIHCGPCGECSNGHDIDVYRATAQTLTTTSKQCALKILTGGRASATTCMAERVGFTPACTMCWIDNMACDQGACLFTCLWSLMRGEKNNRDSKELSTCLKCDELMCGPAFITCAGANRRRLGITTDIGRTSAEFCNTSAV